MKIQKQIFYWAHMLDECFNMNNSNDNHIINESYNINSRIWFHGTPTNRKIEEPTTLKPFFVAEDPNYSLFFANTREDKTGSADTNNGVVHAVTLNPEKLKIFDFSDANDLNQLNLPNIVKYYFLNDKIDAYSVLCELLMVQPDMVKLANKWLAEPNKENANKIVNDEFERRAEKPETDEEWGQPEQEILEFFDGDNKGFTNSDAKEFLLWALPKLDAAGIKEVPYRSFLGTYYSDFIESAYVVVAALLFNDIASLGYNAVTSYELNETGSKYCRCIGIFDKNALDQISIKTMTIQQAKRLVDALKDKSVDVEAAVADAMLNENKSAYLHKYSDELDVNEIVDKFWSIKSRLNSPENDIDWWIKKPFADLKKFVQSQQYAPNKRQRRDADYRMEAMQNDAKVLGERDGYEIWYVPTYEAMKILGRFYKGRSAKWCVASDDPEYWFENHDNDEFVLLIREQPLNDAFDKIAVQMENKGYHFSEDSIIPWDIENNDCTFDRGVVDNAPELIRYAWKLFKENGELREHYYDTEY